MHAKSLQVFCAHKHGARRTRRINFVLLTRRLHRIVDTLAEIALDARLQVRLAPFLVQDRPLQHLRRSMSWALPGHKQLAWQLARQSDLRKTACASSCVGEGPRFLIRLGARQSLTSPS